MGHAFGPIVDGDPLFETDIDKYRVTNLHSTTQQAPAVAICDGTICVVEDDSGGSTVTILLKPHYQPSFDFPFIKYFLFKGIKKSSIISGTAAVLDPDIPFTKRLDEGWDENGGANPKSNSAQALGLAYTASLMHPIDGTQTAIFANDQPIDNFFYYPNDDFQLPVVRAGEYIGYFDQAKFGFEIVLERLGYDPEIRLARSLENVITVDSFTRTNPEPDDADYFMHWHEKETCLNYIDPCAFFGSFCGSEVFYKTGPSSGSSDRTKCNTPQEIYDGILKYFENRQKIYIDIRNDYNFSLNYFKDYGFGIRFQNRRDPVNANDPSTDQTNANGWPISTLDIAKISAAGETKRKFFRTSIRLPTGTNSEPLVYLSKAYVRRFKKLKPEFKAQNPNKLDDTDTLMGFTSAVNLSFPLIDDGSNDAFCAAYYKLNFYDQDRDGNTSNVGLSPSKEHYLNGCFRPLNMKSTVSLAGRELSYTLWHEEILINTNASNGPCFIASVGLAIDSETATLFSFPEFVIQELSDDQLGGHYFKTVSSAKSDTASFLDHIISRSDNGVVQKIELIDDDAGQQILVLDQPSNSQVKSELEQRYEIENYLFLIDSKSKFNDEKATIQTFAEASLPIFKMVEQNTETEDIRNIAYNKIEFGVSYLEKTGNNIARKFASLETGMVSHGDT